MTLEIQSHFHSVLRGKATQMNWHSCNPSTRSTSSSVVRTTLPAEVKLHSLSLTCRWQWQMGPQIGKWDKWGKGGITLNKTYYRLLFWRGGNEEKRVGLSARDAERWTFKSHMRTELWSDLTTSGNNFILQDISIWIHVRKLMERATLLRPYFGWYQTISFNFRVAILQT